MNHRIITDPEQWRALMSLTENDLLLAWKRAQESCETARRQEIGLADAMLWETLIEGAAASRFGTGQHLRRYRAACQPDDVAPS
jgi:hypothetical protein